MVNLEFKDFFIRLVAVKFFKKLKLFNFDFYTILITIRWYSRGENELIKKVFQIKGIKLCPWFQFTIFQRDYVFSRDFRLLVQSNMSP